MPLASRPKADQPADTAPAAGAPMQTAEPQKEFTADKTESKGNVLVPMRAGFGQKLTPYDLKIQKQIHRAGVWQAAVQCQAIVQYAPDFAAYKKLVRELANDGLTYTEE